MSTYYVDSVSGNNSNSGESWALAKQTFAGLHSALSGVFTDGDLIYISSRHNEGGGSASIVSSAGGTPTPVAVASVTYDTLTYERGAYLNFSSSAYDLNFSDSWAFYGVDFKAGDDISIAANVDETLYCYDCKFILDGNDAGSYLNIYAASGICEKCEFTTADTADTSRNGSLHFASSTGQGFLQIIDCTFTNQGFQTNRVFGALSAEFIGCDLSSIGTSAEFFSPSSTARVKFINCKMPATFTLGDGSGCYVASLFNCQSTTGARVGYLGEIGAICDVASTTAVYLTDGAEADNGDGGTQSFSWKMTTNSGISYSSGARLVDPLIVDIDQTGLLNFDVYVGCATELDSADVWMNVYAMLTTGSEKLSLSSNKPGPQGVAGSALTTGGTWTGSGAPAYSYRLRVQATVEEKGLGLVRIYCGTPSLVLWIDPRVTVSAA